jgi:thiol-disulfide isomerase/thioredoxin
MQQLMRRIFANRTMPPEGTSKEEFHKFFDAAVTDFENSGFLDATKFTPIASDEELEEVLRKHKDELVVVKFWKRGCMPCLAFGEMFKAAEKQYADAGKPVKFFSVDTKADDCRDLARYQLVDGTPTILTFHKYRQVGEEIKETSLETFTRAVNQRIPAPAAA